MDKPQRLAVVLSHPTQYYSPWFRHLASRPELELKVFYLWDFGVKETRDRTFGTSFAWDIPLLEGYDHEFVPNRSAQPGTHHFRGLDNPGIVGALQAWRPDAILLFGYNYATHLRVILSPRLRSIPLLFRGDSHELCPTGGGWKTRLGGLARRLLFQRFSTFLAVGTANARYFRTSGVPERKIHTALHCVDNDRFQTAAANAANDAAAWRTELGIDADATVLLFAGKFEAKKRPMDLLQAFLALERNATVPRKVALLFVGNGQLETALRETAGAALGRSVFFAPFQNQSAMPKVYATGDLLVLPSYGRGETWGLAVNEAMNLSRPAIVSSHVGCGPDLIVPGETGWIFPAGEPSALQATLAEAIADPERLRRMGDQARERVGRFSYHAAGDALIAALRA